MGVRLAVTGTPGTGKTTATELLAVPIPVVHANRLVEAEDLYSDRDAERDSLIVDLEALEDAIPAEAIVESHIAHLLEADRVVVLRCHPDELRDRLRTRDESEESIRENVDAEALDVILAEAIARHGRDAVYEIDTTNLDPDDVAASIRAVFEGRRSPSAGIVDFSGAVSVEDHGSR